jgi:hypothetical protein
LVLGKWKDQLHWQYLDQPGKLAERLANWRSGDSEIKAFTKKHGPVVPPLKEVLPPAQIPPRLQGREPGDTVAGTEFSFAVADWRNCQETLQASWANIATADWRTTIRVGFPSLLQVNELVWVDADASWHFPAGPGTGFVYAQGKLVYRAATLWELILLDLISCPRERLRLCGRMGDGCPHPYFVAHHLRQNYCDEPCSEWAQRRSKLDWWNKNGKKQRASSLRGKPKGR